MNDPAYKSGVDPESIVKTVFDIGDVFKGRLSCISAPVPMDGSSPVTHMAFVDPNAEIPKPLNVGVKSPGSRRSHIYNIKNGIDIPSYTMNPIHKEHAVDDEYEIHDDNDITITDTTNLDDAQEYTLESVVHFIDNIKPSSSTTEVKLKDHSSEQPEKTVNRRRRNIVPTN